DLCLRGRLQDRHGEPELLPSPKGLRINSYVVMPTHLHAILFHADFQAKALEQAVTDFRKFKGRRLADFCAEHMPDCFQNVLAERAGGDRDRRLWQPTRTP